MTSVAPTRARELVAAACALLILGCSPPEPAPAPPAAPPRWTFAETHFPGEAWTSVEPARALWDEDKLAEAVSIARAAHTTALVLCYQGRLLFEGYWSVHPPELEPVTRANYAKTRLSVLPSGEPLEDVTSIEKSVAALLLAHAVELGLVDYDDPVRRHLGPGWSRASAATESAITLRHILAMTSGLVDDFEERWPPGTHWRYAPSNSYWLLPVLEAATERSREELLSEWLAEPIGLANTRWTEHEGVSSTGLATTARDLARIGILVTNGGRWGDRQVLGEEALAELLTASQDLNPGYGLSWWLNRPGALRHEKELQGQRPLPDGPADLVMALGLMDKQLSVSADEQIVMVRLGAKMPGRGAETPNAIWRAVLAARPSATTSTSPARNE